jgi:hypothetical protein
LRVVTLSLYLEELKRGALSLLIYRENAIIFSSAGKGVQPFLTAINIVGRRELRGTTVVDRIVGKAVALLTVYIEAAAVHAAILSQSAKVVLQKHNIDFVYAEEAPTILGDGGVGLCPFERLVQEICDPVEAYQQITALVETFSRP